MVNLGNSGKKYEKFFKELIPMLKDAGLSPNGEPEIRRSGNWVRILSLHPNIQYAVAFTKDDSKVEIGFFKCQNWSNAFFDCVHAWKPEIEKRFGGNLSWERKSDKQKSLVVSYSGIPFDEYDRHEEVKLWMVNSLSALQRAFEPYLDDASDSANGAS